MYLHVIAKYSTVYDNVYCFLIYTSFCLHISLSKWHSSRLIFFKHELSLLALSKSFHAARKEKTKEKETLANKQCPTYDAWIFFWWPLKWHCTQWCGCYNKMCQQLKGKTSNVFLHQTFIVKWQRTTNFGQRFLSVCTSSWCWQVHVWILILVFKHWLECVMIDISELA